MATTVKLRQRGVITLPKEVREKYDLAEGDALHLVDLDGAVVLSPMIPVVPELAREIARVRQEQNLTMDELLDSLRSERKRLVRERYGDPPGEESDRSATHGETDAESNSDENG